MAIPISVQLYSLRDAAAKDFTGVLKSVAQIGYPYVEFAGLHNKSAKEVRKLIDDIGLKPSSAHVALFDPAARAKVEDEARALGYTHLVSGFGKDDFASEDKIRAAADKVNAAVNYFGPKGFTVSLHNHEWEFSAPNKGDLLLELAPKAGPQLDVYWIKFGGADPVDVIKRYGKRTHLVHIKDGPANSKNRDLPMTAVGQGQIDIPGVVRAAEYAGVEFLIVELDRCGTDMLQAVADSYNYLTSRSLAKGNR